MTIYLWDTTLAPLFHALNLPTPRPELLPARGALEIGVALAHDTSAQYDLTPAGGFHHGDAWLAVADKQQLTAA